MKLRARQDAIVRVLRRTDTATVAELAAEVGVSRRTVLRDIGALRDQGFVIHTEPGPGGDGQLDPQSVQGAAQLTVVEVFALVISVTSTRMSKRFPFSGLADSGLAKIERGLPPAKVKDLRALLECLHIGRLSPRQNIADMGAMDPALLPAFETAFLQRRLVRFRYRDAKGAETCREVEPQAMLILPPLWYLVAWDPRRSDFRHFRMDRIGGPEVVPDASFRRRRVPFDDDVCPFADLAS